jgi:hypothetical protein
VADALVAHLRVMTIKQNLTKFLYSVFYHRPKVILLQVYDLNTLQALEACLSKMAGRLVQENIAVGVKFNTIMSIDSMNFLSKTGLPFLWFSEHFSSFEIQLALRNYGILRGEPSINKKQLRINYRKESVEFDTLYRKSVLKKIKGLDDRLLHTIIGMNYKTFRSSCMQTYGMEPAQVLSHFKKAYSQEVKFNVH